jgi:iron-sulfur cluster assembly protein
MLTLTEKAAEQVRTAAMSGNAGDMGLRIAAQLNNAGMMEFGMGFDDPADSDIVIDAFGVKILVSPQSAPLLNDMTIDFEDISPEQQGFVFMRAGGGGGCGSGGGCGGCGGGGCS